MTRWLSSRANRARLAAGLAATALAGALLAGCGDGDEPDVATTTTDDTTTTTEPTTTTSAATTTTAEVSLAQSCQAPLYTIGYPEGWFTADDPELRCELFHPEPFTAQRGTEPSSAVFVGTAGISFERYRQELGGRTAEVVSQEPVTIDGRDGLRAELRATGEGLYPAGTLYTVYAVGVDGETLTATAVEGQGGPVDYERQKQVLGAMVRSLDLMA